MPKRRLSGYDKFVHADWTKYQEIEQSGKIVLLGEWFVFFKRGWQAELGTAWLPEGKIPQPLSSSPASEAQQDPLMLFRGQEKIQLPSVEIEPKPLPRPALVSLTCDKSLYRVRQDTVRLLIASP